MTKEQEEIINRLSKITNRQILYGNKCGITIEGLKYAIDKLFEL